MFQRFGKTGAALAGDENRGKITSVEGDDIVFTEGEVGAIGGFDAPADVVEVPGGKHLASEVKFKPATFEILQELGHKTVAAQLVAGDAEGKAREKTTARIDGGPVCLKGGLRERFAGGRDCDAGAMGFRARRTIGEQPFIAQGLQPEGASLVVFPRNGGSGTKSEGGG